MGCLTLVLITTLAASALAGPTGTRSQCSRECNPSQFFQYKYGVTYDYYYETTTYSISSDKKETEIKVKTTAHITPIAACDYALTLSDVVLEDSARSAEFAEALTKYPLKFGFNDGKITEVCGQNEDPTHIVNFKKGILSVFQTSVTHNEHELAKSIKEEDIVGNCETNYHVTENQKGIFEVRKIKKYCSRIPMNQEALSKVSYSSLNNMVGVDCHQNIEEGILKQSNCHQIMDYIPMESVTIHTRSQNNLKFKSQSRNALTFKDVEFERTALLFVKENEEIGSSEEVQEILSDLERTIQNDIRPEVPVLFSDLVYKLKSVNYEQFIQLLSKTSNSKTHKILLDAIPLVGTSSAVKVLSELIQGEQYLNHDIDAAFTSLTFIQEPTADMFVSLKSIVESSDDKNALLGVASLIRNYCKLHSSCGEEPAVQSIMEAYSIKIKPYCAYKFNTATFKEREQFLMYVRNLYNLAPFKTISELSQCLENVYTNTENPIEIRLATFEAAHRNAPCEADKEQILNIYQDVESDSELRIAAYKALIKCPTKNIMDIIRENLKSEPVNQVGSYVYSHLTNLQESASPEKQFAREIIGEEQLDKKFNAEVMKFSRNYETSFYNNVSQIGASLESDVIFSTQSFLPRSAMFNLTVELFGETFNLLEVGGRMEGFEAYVEKFFGPDGYFPEETVAEIIKNLRESKSKPDTTLEEFLENITDEPELTYYMEFFGNTMHYEHLHGSEIFEPSKKQHMSFMELMMQLARKGKVDYSKSKKIIDKSVMYPMISGFPMKLKANSTATIGMQIDGDFKIHSMDNININGKVYPSAAVELDASMIIDAHFTKKGLMIKSNLHSSSFIDGKLKIQSGKLVDVAFNMPKEKIEIINFKSDVFEVDGPKLIDLNTDVDVNQKCSKKLSTVLGVAICAKTVIPKKNILLPKAIEIFVEKEDSHTGYILQIKRAPTSVDILFDTPGSQINRKFKINVNGSPKELVISVKTPFINAEGTGKIHFDNNKKQLEATLNLDNNNEYAIKYNALSTGQRHAFETERSLLIKSPSGELVNAHIKHLVNRESHKYIADYSFNSFMVQEPIKLHGAIAGINMEKILELKLNTPYGMSEIYAVGKATPNELAYDLNLLVSSPYLEEKIHNMLSIKRNVEGQMGKYSLKFQHDDENRKEINFEIDTSVVKEYNTLDIISTLKTRDHEFTYEKNYAKSITEDNGVLYKVHTLVKDENKVYVDKSQSLRITNNEVGFTSKGKVFSMDSNVDVTLTKDYSINVDVQATGVYDEPIVFQVKTLQHGYSVKYQLGSVTHFQADYENQSTSLMFDFKANVILDLHRKGSLSLLGTTTKAFVQFKANNREDEYFMTGRAQESAVSFKTNIYKKVNLEAKLETETPTKKIQVTADYEDTLKLNAVGTISQNAVSANLRYGDKEYLLNAEIGDGFMEFSSQYAPEKIIKSRFDYSIGNPTNLEISLETPFEGYEKQYAKYNFKMGDRKVFSKFSLNFKNSEQISFVLNGNYEDLKKIDFSAELTSNLPSVKNGVMEFKTDMGNGDCDLLLNAKYSDKQINFSTNCKRTDDGYILTISHESFFTDPLNAKVEYHHNGMDFESTLAAKIGEQSIDGHLNAKINKPDFTDMTGDLLIEGTCVPKVEAKMKVDILKSEGDIQFDGTIGSKKVLFSTDYKKTIADKKSFVANVKFITPVTYPFTFSLNHQVSNEGYDSTFVITRFWSDKGTLKGHLDAKVIDFKSNMHISATMISPDLRSAMEVKHLLNGQDLQSKINVNVNGENLSLDINGKIEPSNSIIDAALESSFKQLDDIKMHFGRSVNGNNQLIQLTLKKGEHTLNIENNLEHAENKLINTLNINDKYSIFIHFEKPSNDEMKLLFTIAKEDQKINLDSYREKNTFHATLETPFTSPIKVDAKIPTEIKVLYSDGKIIELRKINDTPNGVQLYSLKTPYMDDIEFGFKLSTNDMKMVSLKYGANIFDASLEFALESITQGNFNFNLKTRRLPQPLNIKVSHDLSNYEKNLQVSITTDKKYDGKLTLSTQPLRYGAAAEIHTPLKEVSFLVKSDFTGPKYHLKTQLTLDSQKFSASGEYDKNSIKLIGKVNEKSGTLTSSYDFTPKEGKINFAFNSEFSEIEDISLMATYNVDAKKCHLELSHGASNVSIFGKFDNQMAQITGTSTIPGLKTFDGSITFSMTDVHITLSREDRKIEMIGQANISDSKGDASITVTTPYSGFENMDMKIKYAFDLENYKIDFESNVGEKKTILHAETFLEDYKFMKFNVNAQTPFEQINKIILNVEGDFKTNSKSIKANLNHNEGLYNLDVLINPENNRKGQFMTKITTPIVGLKSAEINLDYDFVKMPFAVKLDLSKEDTTETFSGKIDLTNNIFVEIHTPINNFEHIEINGDYEKTDEGLNYKLNLKKDDVMHMLKGKLKLDATHPLLDVTFEAPNSVIRVLFKANITKQQKNVKAELTLNQDTYAINAHSALSKKQGKFMISTILPNTQFGTLEINGKYDFLSDVKSAEIDIKNNGEQQNYSFQININNNLVEIDIKTSLDGYKSIELRGDYSKKHSKHSTFGSMTINKDIKYKFDGFINFKKMAFDISIVSPISAMESISASGKVRENKVDLEIKTSTDKYIFKAEYKLEKDNAFIKIVTPLRSLKTLEIGVKYMITKNEVEIEGHIQRNSNKFVVKAKGIFDKLKSKFNFEAASLKDSSKYGFSLDYDFLHNHKYAEAILIVNDKIKTVKIEQEFDLNSGLLKIETPFYGYENTGIVYSLNINKQQKSIDASLTLNKNSDEYSFKLNGIVKENEVNIVFKTPFSPLETLSIKGKLSSEEKTGKMIIDIGKLRFSADITYAYDNLGFEFVTPYSEFKKISAHASYNFNNQKTAKISFGHNDNNYEINFSFKFGSRSSEVTMKGETPFKSLHKLAFSSKYDFDNQDELIKCELALNEREYNILIGGYIQEKVAFGRFDLTLPHSSLSNVSLRGKIDLNDKNKALEITMRRGDSDLINLNGKLIGNAADLSLNLPIYGFENFSVSFSRSKRAAMNDDDGAHFNSLNITIKTPYRLANEISIDVSNKEGAFEIHYKRNDYFLDLSVETTGKKKEVKLTINSQIPAAEFLAIIGKLDREDIHAYLSGQRNSEKMSIEVHGNRDSNMSSLTINAKTPFDDYKNVDIEFQLNRRAKSLKLNGKSSSSDFKIDVNAAAASLKASIHIPKPTVPTDIDVDLRLQKGHIYMQSRFPAVRDFKLDYKVNMAKDIEIEQTIELNNVKVFDLMFHQEESKTHFKVIGQRTGHKSEFHYHREGMNKVMITFNRDGKEFKLNAEGSGDLPNNGHVELVGSNAFFTPERTLKMKIDLDRTSEPKTLKIEVDSSRMGVHFIDLKYNADLKNMKSGDFDLTIMGKDKSMKNANHIKGTFSFKSGKSKVTLDVNGRTYKAVGKITPYESNITLKSNNKMVDSMFLEYRFHKDAPKRDYFIKVGRENNYFLAHIDGEFKKLTDSNMEVTFRLPFVMEHDFVQKINYHKESNGAIVAEGVYTYGDYHSNLAMEFKREASTRSAEFSMKFTSNIPGFNKFNCDGSYNFNNQAVVHLKIDSDRGETVIDLNLNQLASEFSENEFSGTLPSGKQFSVSFGHDFRNPLGKSAHFIVQYGTGKTHLEVKVERDSDFKVLKGLATIHSDLLSSDVHLSVEYDVKDLDNASVSVEYKRNADKFVRIQMKRNSSNKSAHSEMNFESHFKTIPSAKLYIDANYKGKVDINAGLEVADKSFSFHFLMEKQSIELKLETPMPGFELLTGNVKYNLSKKQKTVNLDFKRGNREIHLTFDLSTPKKNQGTIDMELSTPYDVIKSVKLHGNINNKKANIKYSRNGVESDFNGTVELTNEQGEFSIHFTPPNGQPVDIKVVYDVKDFIAGTLEDIKNIAGLELKMFGKEFEFEVEGRRTDQDFYLEVSGNSDLDELNKFEIEIKRHSVEGERNVELEIHLNEHHLAGEFQIQKKPNGFYYKARCETSLTPLPGVVVGFGKEGDEVIITAGIGEDREVTFTVKAKNGFKDGFSGRVSVPAIDLENITYDVNYKFVNDNELELHIHINYGDDREMHIRVLYNSDGVKARLTSPFGSHFLRAKRSISNSGFETDIGYNDYSVTLKGTYDDNKRRGIIIEGQIFGTPVSLDTFFYKEGNNYAEGKFIVQSTFFRSNKLGGLFTYSNEINHKTADIELYIPSVVSPKCSAHFNLNHDKEVSGIAEVNIFNERYSIQVDANKNPIQELSEVKIQAVTPYHTIGEVFLSGSVKVKSLMDLFIDLNIDHPYGIDRILLKNEGTINKFTSEFQLSNTYYSFDIDAIATVKNTVGEKSLDLTLNKMNSHIFYKSESTKRSFGLNTELTNLFKSVQFNYEKNSLSDIKGNLKIETSNHVHNIKGEYNLESDKVVGKLDVDGILKMNIYHHLHSEEALFKQFETKLEFEALSKHFILLNLKHIDGINLNIEARSPTFDKIIVQLKTENKAFNIMVETMKGVAKLNGDYDYVLKNGVITNGQINLEAVSSRFGINYKIILALKENMPSIKFNDGVMVHECELVTEGGERHGNFMVYVKTSLFDIGEYRFKVNYDFNENIAVHTELQHSFLKFSFDLISDFILDLKNRHLKISIDSSNQSIGSMAAEGSFEGNTAEDMKFAVKLLRNDFVINSLATLKMKSNDDMLVKVSIQTPISNYDFGATYKKGDTTVFEIYGENPIHFKINGEFGSRNSLFISKINIETPIENLKKISGKISLPLNRFAPIISLTIDDRTYGLELDYHKHDSTRFLKTLVSYETSAFMSKTSIKDTAPYEINYEFADNRSATQAYRGNLRGDSLFSLFLNPMTH